MNRDAIIVGAGALGKALAYSLQEAALGDVGLYARSGPLTTSFQVLDRGVPHEVALSRSQPGQAEHYFFTTKTYDLVPALEAWLPRIDPRARIILLSNGYIEPLLTRLRRTFPEHVLHKGVVTRGAKFLSGGILELSDKGHISWGDDGLPTLFEQELFSRRPELKWDADACRTRRDKWYCNTVLNTLSGAYRLPNNGAALSHADYHPLAEEVYQLGAMLWPEWANETERLRLKTLMDELIGATRHNENSMAVDARLNRPTEIDVLSGVAKTMPGYEHKFPVLSRLHKTIERHQSNP